MQDLLILLSENMKPFTLLVELLHYITIYKICTCALLCINKFYMRSTSFTLMLKIVKKKVEKV